VQSLIKARRVLAGHDVSDGGLLTAVLEMAFAGDKGVELVLPTAPLADRGGDGSLASFAAAFAEEPGLIVEVDVASESELVAAMDAAAVPCILLGTTTVEKHVRVSIGDGAASISTPLCELRDVWEATSFELEKLQCSPECVVQERASLKSRQQPLWTLTFTPGPTSPPADPPCVAVVRQEGSNGDREMAAALHAAGLAPWDVTMTDLVGGAVTLDRFRGLVFVGGFSYADVLGSAKGWAAVLRFNAPLWAQLQAFRARRDTFSLGVCNGCQLLALLGWVPGQESIASPETAEAQPRFVHNASGRFSSVTIMPSPAVLLRGMEGSTMGVWVAHGEGRAHFPQRDVLDSVLAHNLAPIRYVDDAGKVTQAYPHNPNGGTHGIAALCSRDGRHLAMMPHPERCFLPWQWPWMPQEWRGLKAGPWLSLFQNALRFCEETGTSS
jgi:phosphoribosylformylglycinamidine synthase